MKKEELNAKALGLFDNLDNLIEDKKWQWQIQKKNGTVKNDSMQQK